MNLALNFILYNIIILRVCLFEGEIRWMENFGKKNRKKNFFKVCLAGWGEKKINNETQVFFLRAYQNIFSLKWRKN